MKKNSPFALDQLDEKFDYFSYECLPAPLSVYECSPNKDVPSVVYYNKAYAREFVLEKSEGVFLKNGEIDFDHFFYGVLSQTSKNQTPHRVNRFFEKFGSHYEINVFPVGESRVACLFRNSTEEYEQENKLKEVQTQFQILADQFEGAVVCYDKERKRQHVSSTYKELLGIQPAYVLGKKLYDESLPLGLGKELHHALEETFSKGQEISCLYTHFHSEKGPRHIDIRFIPVEKEGKVFSVISLSRDVTAIPREHFLQDSLGPSKSRILVVDDEEGVRFVLEHFLKEIGFDVVSASSGKEALALLEKGAFDCIMSDHVMPSMSGVEFVEEIKKRFPDLKVPIISLSGMMNEVSLIDENLFDAAVTKPFDFDELSKIVSRYKK